MKHIWFLSGTINGILALLLSASCALLSPPLTLPPASPTIPATEPISTATLLPDTPTSGQPVDPAVSAWLRESAIPFDTTDPEAEFADLMPLNELIGDARIVALGEATHGTHEFFEMKHRMFRFLVKEMGFNTFAVEASWAETNLINDYVRTGQGDPAKLLDQYFGWTGDTQEVLDMILWMRAHNENPGDAPLVSFYGFDTQFYEMAMDNVLAYLEQVDPDRVAETIRLYYCFSPDRKRLYIGSSAESKAACRANLQVVYDQLSQKQSEYEARSSPEAFARALQSARVVLQVEHQVSLGDHDYLVRDQYMAENVTWLLDQAGPGGKIVLSAHNFHVSTDDSIIKTMGAHLREAYGGEMVVFGFSFYEGSFNSRLLADTAQMGEEPGELMEFAASSPPEDSYESYFRSTELPLFFLDLRRLPSDPAARNWLSTSHPFRSIGAAYQPSHPEEFIDPAILPDLFDVIIYFQDTSPSLLLE
ncbi:MAG TPA: erythromycin esterase family protein [Anaerolineales bacterium]|nr:erythromycin esterase family protein [Anaerolineales bacterium]